MTFLLTLIVGGFVLWQVVCLFVFGISTLTWKLHKRFFAPEPVWPPRDSHGIVN